MSNAPYTTNKLISYLMGGPIEVRARETIGSDDKEFADAIIVRLRAADTLCEAAKIARKDFNIINGLLKKVGFHPFTLTPKDLDKAIAEYEGKK
jgi:hypothetical protein